MPPIFPPHLVMPLDGCAPTDPAFKYMSRIRKFEYPSAYTMSGVIETTDPLNLSAVFREQVWPAAAYRGRVLDRIQVWISNLTPIASVLGTLPPALRVDLRAGYSHLTDLYTSVNVLPPAWQDEGLIFSFAGLNATQWEIWAGTFDGGANRPAVPVEITWVVLINSSGCCMPHTEPGPWVIV